MTTTTRTPEQTALQIYNLFLSLPRQHQERLLAEIATLIDGPEAA